MTFRARADHVRRRLRDLARDANRPVLLASVTLLAVGSVLALAGLGAAATNDGSTTADWIEAIATVAAFVAAAGAAMFAIRAYRLESNRERRFLADLRKEQAAKVAAWPGLTQIRAKPGLPAMKEVPSALIRNASDVPVTQARLRIYSNSHHIGDQYVGTIPPGDDPVPLRILERIVTASSWTVTFDDDGEPLDPEFEIAIEFKDSSGTWWMRDEAGELSELRRLEAVDG